MRPNAETSLAVSYTGQCEDIIARTIGSYGDTIEKNNHRLFNLVNTYFRFQCKTYVLFTVAGVCFQIHFISIH